MVWTCLSRIVLKVLIVLISQILTHPSSQQDTWSLVCAFRFSLVPSVELHIRYICVFVISILFHHRNTGWSSSQTAHQTEMSTMSLCPQGSLWSPRRPPRCWSLQERARWVSRGWDWRVLNIGIWWPGVRLHVPKPVMRRTQARMSAIPSKQRLSLADFSPSESKSRGLKAFFLLSCRRQATEAGRGEGWTVVSDQEAEESAGGRETEALKGGQRIHRWGEDGERYRPTPYWDAE